MGVLATVATVYRISSVSAPAQAFQVTPHSDWGLLGQGVLRVPPRARAQGSSPLLGLLGLRPQGHQGLGLLLNDTGLQLT